MKFSQVQEILVEMTGNDIAEIGPQALLEDELGVTPVDFSRIIAKLNTQFDINLDARELMDEKSLPSRNGNDSPRELSLASL